MRCLPIHSVKDLIDFLARERFPAEEREIAARGLFPCSLFLEDLSPDLAESLLDRVKQTGGWGRIRGAPDGGPRGSGIILCCPLDALGSVSEEIRNAVGPDQRDRVAIELEGIVRQMTREGPPPVRYQGKTLDFSRGPVLMAVLNVTPDSFFDGGRYRDTDKAVAQGIQMIREGAHILDVGGASSRPGSDLVPEEEQLDRILPVIREIRKQWDGWISVDTYSAPVARAAVGEGADMINDISAGRIDPEMKQVAGETGVPAVLMHMKGTPRDMQKNPVYQSLLSEMVSYFEDCIRAWENAGVDAGNILVDPGIGFGKTLEHNLQILRNLEELKVLGKPVLLGTSRKAFIGSVLDRKVEDRLAGTLGTLAVGAMNGADVFRVHDVAEARDTLALVHAIQRA